MFTGCSTFRRPSSQMAAFSLVRELQKETMETTSTVHRLLDGPWLFSRFMSNWNLAPASSTYCRHSCWFSLTARFAYIECLLLRIVYLLLISLSLRILETLKMAIIRHRCPVQRRSMWTLHIEFNKQFCICSWKLNCYFALLLLLLKYSCTVLRTALNYMTLTTLMLSEVNYSLGLVYMWLAMCLRSPQAARISLSLRPLCGGRRLSRDFRTDSRFTGIARFVRKKFIQIFKNRKPIPRRLIVAAIALSLYGRRSDAALWSCSTHTIFSGHVLKNKSYGNCGIVGHSYGPRTVIAWLARGACTVPMKSHEYRAVILRQPHSGRTMAVRGPWDVQIIRRCICRCFPCTCIQLCHNSS